jgi:outer membrane protein insertion porin family
LGGGEPEILPISVRVQEAPTFTTKFGVGYGKEDKFRVFGSLQWLRFLGGARSLDFFAKHSALEPYHLSVSFTQPDFPFRLAKFVLNPYALKEVEPAYTAARLGSNVALKRDFFENLEISTTYTYERVDQLANAEGAANDSYRKSSVALLFLNDASRPLFDPIRGWNVSGGFSYTRILKNDSTFFKTGVDVRRYFDPFGGTILAAKLKTSLIFPVGAGNVPLEERLYSGGATSVRGFPRSSLGPVDASGVAIGGNTLLEASLEFRIPVAGIVGLAAFCDAGNVWQEPATYRLSELRYAAGAGVRFKTPVGPIRFDIARPIFEGDGEIEYYFTLGQAF